MIVAVDVAALLRQSPTDPRAWEPIPGAVEALRALRRAHHTVVAVGAAKAPWEADWRANPLWSARVVPFDVDAWKAERADAEAQAAAIRAGLDGAFPGLPFDESGAYAVLADAYVGENAGFDTRDSERSWRRFVARVA